MKTIFNKTVNESNSSTKNETVNEGNSSTKNESKSGNKSDYERDCEIDYKHDYEIDYKSDNEGDNLTNKDENYYEIKKLNNWFKTIDQTKSLEEPRELLKSENFLYEHWSLKYYNSNKDLNYKIFKAKAAGLVSKINKEIFKKLYGCNFIALAEKLINTVDKEENQTIVNGIKNNKNKIYRKYKFDEVVVKHRGKLIDAVKIILEINEALNPNKVNYNDLM